MFLLVALLASVIASFLGWVYLVLLPLFIVSILILLKNRPKQFSADQAAQNQLLTEIVGVIHECEINLNHISTTQSEAMMMLNDTCKKQSLLQSMTDEKTDKFDNQVNKSAQISAITNETLGFVRGLISDLALHSSEPYDSKVVEQLQHIYNRQSQKLNPAASIKLKSGAVELF